MVSDESFRDLWSLFGPREINRGMGGFLGACHKATDVWDESPHGSKQFSNNTPNIPFETLRNDAATYPTISIQILPNSGAWRQNIDSIIGKQSVDFTVGWSSNPKSVW